MKEPTEANQANTSGYPANRYVIIEDIDISFWNMVVLLVKFAFAVIPASILVGGIWLVIMMLFGGLVGR